MCLTTQQAAERQAAHVTTAAEVFKALDDLVRALDETSWSSWQTTAKFDKQLRYAEQVLIRAKEQQ